LSRVELARDQVTLADICTVEATYAPLVATITTAGEVGFDEGRLALVASETRPPTRKWCRRENGVSSFFLPDAKMVSVHFSFRGRPLGRGINAMFNLWAICSVHSGVPSGRPLRRSSKRCQFIFPSEDARADGGLTRSSKRCQFIFPSEDARADGGLTRCSIFGLSGPSIPEPRVAGRSARNHAPTSTRLLFAHHRPSLATACAVLPQFVPVRPTRETDLRAGRHVPSHGKRNSTTDNPRGPRPAWPGLGWPRCTAERPANEHPIE
jgi:hypothetical protein